MTVAALPDAGAWPKARRLLPGFGLTLGTTLLYLSAMVVLPLAALAATASGLGWQRLLAVLGEPRIAAAFRVSFGIAGAAALTSGALGLLLAWVLERERFPGRRLLDGIVDLPFALPTAVAGITLATLWGDAGWLGAPLDRLGIAVSFTPLGIFVALVFIGLPFVVRTLQPAILELDRDAEDAAGLLGAGRGTVFRRVVLPELAPALVTGMALAFARALGEYGSVIFIAGNMPRVSEIVPLLIVIRLEEFDYPGAAALAVAMLAASLAILLLINRVEAWTRRRHG